MSLVSLLFPAPARVFPRPLTIEQDDQQYQARSVPRTERFFHSSPGRFHQAPQKRRQPARYPPRRPRTPPPAAASTASHAHEQHVGQDVPEERGRSLAASSDVIADDRHARSCLVYGGSGGARGGGL